MKVNLTRRYVELNRAMLRAFVAAHGLDPESVPVPSTLSIDNDNLTVEQYVKDEDGQWVVVGPNYMIQRTTVTIPLHQKWPDNLVPENQRSLNKGRFPR